MSGAVPDVLESWTLATVEALTGAGVPEGETHDFKHSLLTTEKLTKLCCAFANTRGGFVVLGVEEASPWAITGVEPDKEVYGHFMDRIHAEPQIEVPMPRIIGLERTDRLLYVFHVPRGRRRPHAPTEKDRRAFWKRVGPSCERMTRDEVRALMFDEEQVRQKLGLLLLELRNIMWMLESSTDPNDGATYTFEIIDRVTVEAYGLLREDPQTVQVLSTLKRGLMKVNAATQRFMLEAARGPRPQQAYYTAHENARLAALSGTTIINEQIERSFAQRFDVHLPR